MSDDAVSAITGSPIYSLLNQLVYFSQSTNCTVEVDSRGNTISLPKEIVLLDSLDNPVQPIFDAAIECGFISVNKKKRLVPGPRTNQVEFDPVETMTELTLAMMQLEG